MVSSDWLNPHGGLHHAVRVGSNLFADHFSAFALKRPDGSSSLLMINKDPSRPAQITLQGDRAFRGAATLITYSAQQYHWYAEGPHGRPTRNKPPSQRTVRADQSFTVPAWSISVLRSQ
jgi:hypothetical protein